MKHPAKLFVIFVDQHSLNFGFVLSVFKLSMIQQDRKEKERSEAKNSVEEYIYEAREKISGDYEKFIKEEVSWLKGKLVN